MQAWNLTETQKSLLRWLVEQVRTRKLDEEEIWFYWTLDGTSLVGFQGKVPEVKPTTLDALQNNGCLLCVRSHKHEYRCALAGKAYEAVDSNFGTPSLSAIPHSINCEKLSTTTISNLPKRTKAQRIGEKAADLLNSVLTEFCNVIPVPQNRDLGIDFICDLMQGETPTGKLFYIQCKGKEEVEVESDSIQVSIAVTTLNYWLRLPNPTLLIVVDLQKRVFYWSFPKTFLSSLSKNWQQQQTVSIPVSIQNFFDQDTDTLPAQLISIVNTQASVTPQHGDYFGTLTLEFDRSCSPEKMTIKGLMHYYLEGSQIANVKSAYGSPGSTVTVHPETFGGEGYSKEVKARAWGELKGGEAILLQMPGERNYVLSHDTFKQICYLLSIDIANYNLQKKIISRGGYPGGSVSVEVDGRYISAIAWYEIPPGELNLFMVNGQWYAISLVASKTISIETRERRTGSYLNTDPRRAIAWHYFDLSGLNYSLPLKF